MCQMFHAESQAKSHAKFQTFEYGMLWITLVLSSCYSRVVVIGIEY